MDRDRHQDARQQPGDRHPKHRAVPGQYSVPFEKALTLAAAVHQDQKKKGTRIPYITHPVHVARILERHGRPENVVLAGLLHDVLEDIQPEEPAVRARLSAVVQGLRGLPDEPHGVVEAVGRYIGMAFGWDTLRLVEAVTEKKKDKAGSKRPWLQRKLEKLRALRNADKEVAALKAADLLHNVMAITRDLGTDGPGVMRRFEADAGMTLWQYGTASTIAWERLGTEDRLALELNQAFRTLERTFEEAGGGKSRLPGTEFDTEGEVEPAGRVCVLGSGARSIYGVSQWFDVAPPRQGARHWKDGRSAKELARGWFRDVFAAVPEELTRLFDSNDRTRGMQVATALAEWTTPLGDDDEREGRNHDLLLLGKAGERRIVVGIEAKADEEFGPIVGDRRRAAIAKNAEPGRQQLSIVPERVDRLCQMLFGRRPDEQLDALRYQLLHGLAGTIIEAQRRDAGTAVFVVHEFLDSHSNATRAARNQQDLDRFLAALGRTPASAHPGDLIGPLKLVHDNNLLPVTDVFVGKAISRQAG